MPIAFDAAFHNDQSNVNEVLTFSFTVGVGSNRIMFAAPTCTGAQTVVSVTYAGASMTRINTQAYILGVSELWALANPASGANNVVVTYSATPTGDDCVVASYSGALQSVVMDSQGTATAVGDVTDTRTSIADNCWHVAAMANQSNNFSAGTNMTFRSEASNVRIGDFNAAISPAGANSITGNNTGASFTNGATFAPFVAVSPKLFTLLGVGT